MPESLGFETIAVDEIYKGGLVSLYLEKVKPPEGSPYVREVIRGVRAAAIIALTNAEEIVLIEQYRQPARGGIFEIPAGLVERGEHPEQTAARELKEETGFTARQLEHLVDFYTTPGYSDEVLSLFLASELIEQEASPDIDEAFEVLTVGYEEARRMIKDGTIKDAKTIISILLVGDRIGTDRSCP